MEKLNLKTQKLNLKTRKLNFPGIHWRGLAVIGAQKKPLTFNSPPLAYLQGQRIGNDAYRKQFLFGFLLEI